VSEYIYVFNMTVVKQGAIARRTPAQHATQVPWI